ncbi:MAG: hypothetical protein ACWGQW_04095 [bacterium]
MASSRTQICNLAISWLAGNRITSLEDDPSIEARLCRENYEESRRSVLEEREWTFALKRAMLSSLAETPIFGYEYAFLVPPDCLRVIEVRDTSTTTRTQAPSIPHVVENRKIYANVPVIHVRYLMDLEDITKFSSLFTQALAAHIAKSIAIPLTENMEMLDNMSVIYENNLYKAITTDSLQGTREMLNTSQMEETRRMYTRPR